MLAYRLFFGVGLLIILFGFVGNWVYQNYRDCREKLKIDFQEGQDDWNTGTNESDRL